MAHRHGFSIYRVAEAIEATLVAIHVVDLLAPHREHHHTYQPFGVAIPFRPGCDTERCSCGAMRFVQPKSTNSA